MRKMGFRTINARKLWKKVLELFTIRVKLLLLVFLIFVVTIHCTLQGPNPTSHFLLTKSIAERSSFWFPLEYKEQYWLSPDYAQIEDKLYSEKAPGLSFLAVPFFIFGKILGNVLIESNSIFKAFISPYLDFYPDNDVLSVVGIQVGLSFLAAFGILRLYDVSRIMGISERKSILASVTTAFATPYWVYARTMFGHVPAGVFLICGLYHILKFREKKRIFHLILAGFFSGYGFVIEFPSLFAIPWLAVLVVFPLNQANFSWKNRFTALLVYGIVTAISALPLFYYNLVSFGDITANALAFSHWADYLHLLEPVQKGIIVLLLSNDRGLLYFSPLVLFGFAGLLLAYRRYPLEIMTVFSMILCFIIFYSKKLESHGGAAFGPRYIVPILLLVGLGFGWMLEAMKSSSLTQGCMIVTGIWSFFSTFLGSIYTVLVFGEGDPIFEIAVEKLILEELNTPLLTFLLTYLSEYLQWNSFSSIISTLVTSIIIITLASIFFIILLIIYDIVFQSNTQRDRQKEPSNQEYLEAYSIFSFGNFVFIFVYFTELCYILSATYINFWEQRNEGLFPKELPPSELLIILAFILLSLHSIWMIVHFYSPQIAITYQKILRRIKNKSNSSSEVRDKSL